MGMNYSWQPMAPCEHCGRGYEEEQIHIGKSSSGWCFALHVYPEMGIRDLADWQAKWATGRIVNDSGEVLTPAQMLAIITERKGPEDDKVPYGYGSWTEFYTLNHAQAGPNGLLRCRVDGRECIGHGEGTWDLLACDFC